MTVCLEGVAYDSMLWRVWLIDCKLLSLSSNSASCFRRSGYMFPSEMSGFMSSACNQYGDIALYITSILQVYLLN